MNFLETRITKLEAQIDEKEMDVSDVELFDIHGNKISDAKIIRLPTDWTGGVAELPDGAEKEIAPIGNWADIILESERFLNRENSKIDDGKATQKDYSDVLFLRKNGIQSAVEIIYGANND